MGRKNETRAKTVLFARLPEKLNVLNSFPSIFMCAEYDGNNKKRLKIQNTDLLIMELNKNNVDLVCF